MFKQIIKPIAKEDLIVRLPEEFLEKEIEVDAYEVKRKNMDEEKSREEILEDVFKLWDSMKVSTKDFKFNRDEANER